MDAPTAECFWVEPGRLLAGRHPGAHGDPAAATATVEAIVRAGATLFLDLTEEGELAAYAHLLAGRARHLRRPIVDMWVCGGDELAETLDAIDDELARGGVVYVHCWGGCGRTGTVVSAWWVRHGTAPLEALERYRRAAGAFTSRRCPETPEQEALVLGWGAGA
ncbi:MAG TPA: protein-tyrosine phosphatase family protein [Gaiellaceae bacterium]